jgi:hypothetical protein
VDDREQTADQELRALRVALAESERARVEAELTVQRMQGSLSWRLTAPLRSGLGRLRARRQR